MIYLKRKGKTINLVDTIAEKQKSLETIIEGD